jgi:hypothetical protein
MPRFPAIGNGKKNRKLGKTMVKFH